MKILGYLFIIAAAILFVLLLVRPVGYIELNHEEQCSWHWGEGSQFWVLMASANKDTKDTQPFSVLVNGEEWFAHKGGPLNARGNRVSDVGPMKAEGRQCFSLQVQPGKGDHPVLSVFTGPRHLSEHQEIEIHLAAIFFLLFWGCIALLWARTRDPTVLGATFGFAALGISIGIFLLTEDTILPTDGEEVCFWHLIERDRKWGLELQHPVNGKQGKPFRIWINDILLFEQPTSFQTRIESKHLASRKLTRGKECFRLETQEGVGEIPLIEVSARGTLLGTMYERRLLMILLFFNLGCAIGFIAWSHLRDRKRRPPPAWRSE